MEQRLTPRQLALATGVSESSIKRWCDSGEIATVKTPGGHRRIPLSDAINFVREGQHDLVRPEVLGLPPGTRRGQRRLEDAAAHLTFALSTGDENAARRVLLDLYLGGEKISAIGDRVVAPSFVEIGHGWETGDVQVFQERRAVEIVRNLLHELRLAQPTPPATEPIAIGGTTSGDSYALAPILVELVLRESSWQASYLGANLPIDSLAAAIAQHGPRLFWLSVSHIENEPQFLADYSQLQAAAHPHTAIAVGGRALHESLRQQMVYSSFCETLAQLETFASTMREALKTSS